MAQLCGQGCSFFFFFFNDTATPEIYTLSLHDALPIFVNAAAVADRVVERIAQRIADEAKRVNEDRKSTRLNSSHGSISSAVFCLNKQNRQTTVPGNRGRKQTENGTRSAKLD